MNKLRQYQIPFKGLKEGQHQLQFEVKDDFFGHFKETYLHSGDIDISINLDKRSSLLVLDIDFSGTVKVVCDLCCEEGDLPISGKEQLLVKFTETPGEEEQVIYLMPGETILDIAQHLYEFITLSVPIRRVPCANKNGEPTCNSKALDLIGDNTTDTNKGESINPIWAELEKLKNISS